MRESSRRHTSSPVIAAKIDRAIFSEAFREFARSIESQKRKTMIHADSEHLELSVAGPRGLEMQLAISSDFRLSMFSKVAFISKFPLSALPIRSHADILQLLQLMYQAAKKPAKTEQRNLTRSTTPSLIARRRFCGQTESLG